MPEVPLLSCFSLELPGFSGSSMWSRDPWLLPIFLQSSMHSRGCSSSYFFVYCLGRFRRSITDCSKMFLAVSAAWDKGNENTQKQKNEATYMLLLWIILQNMVLWKYEMTQWAGISLSWITGFVHTCAFVQNIYFILYKNSIQNKLDHCKTNINKDKGKQQISKEPQDFVTEVLFLILKISAVLESKEPRTNWHSRFYEVLC